MRSLTRLTQPLGRPGSKADSGSNDAPKYIASILHCIGLFILCNILGLGHLSLNERIIVITPTFSKSANILCKSLHLPQQIPKVSYSMLTRTSEFSSAISGMLPRAVGVLSTKLLARFNALCASVTSSIGIQSGGIGGNWIEMS